MFKGQTTMIRYFLTVTESKAYDLKFSLTSTTLSPDQYEIQKFFISNIGDNFPCISLSNQQILSITNGYIFDYQITKICIIINAFQFYLKNFLCKNVWNKNIRYIILSC